VGLIGLRQRNELFCHSLETGDVHFKFRIFGRVAFSPLLRGDRHSDSLLKVEG
jgi:hypothetical protein